MGARSKHDRDDDRQTILAALSESGPLRIDELLTIAWGIPEHVDNYGREAHMRTDLNALVRQHRIVTDWSPGHVFRTYRLATDDDLDADADCAELSRLYSGWQPADGGWNTAQWDEAQ